MVRQHAFNQLDVAILSELVNPNHRRIKPRPEAFVLVQDKHFTAAHACAEIFTGPTKNHHDTTRHVLTSMIANALHNCDRTGIAHGEAFTCHPVEISLSARCAIQHDVTDNDIL